ncbi:MAG: hypothetical protein WDO73_32300 [Ignavibacteriota bacterium]
MSSRALSEDVELGLASRKITGIRQSPRQCMHPVAPEAEDGMRGFRSRETHAFCDAAIRYARQPGSSLSFARIALPNVPLI